MEAGSPMETVARAARNGGGLAHRIARQPTEWIPGEASECQDGKPAGTDGLLGDLESEWASIWGWVVCGGSVKDPSRHHAYPWG
eukprot:4314101-Pyramimonas_sp.AAC.1